MEAIPTGSVTSPQGFTAAATTCGLKQSGASDLALLVSGRDCTAAGVFTRNEIVAAPVTLDRETLAGNAGRIRAVVANAGNANAVTGKQGMDDARRMQALVAAAVGCAPEQVLVLSTGVIGVPLPMNKVANGIADAQAQLSAGGGPSAARAIMTTDTRPKHLAVQVEIDGQQITVGGMAKGSGMIHPDMATMLAVLTTDAVVPAEQLQEMLEAAVAQSFNHISIDGDTSTNDTVLLLANGASSVVIDEDARGGFETALSYLCVQLAKMIVRDGEGASKLVAIHVAGAPSEADAHAIANTIATSPLVKTAFAGSDPNWGRILMAAGRAGVPLDPAAINLWIAAPDGDPLQLVAAGAPTAFSESEAAEIFAHDEFSIQLDLGLGAAGTTVWTCDLTHDYVTINADYRT